MEKHLSRRGLLGFLGGATAAGAAVAAAGCDPVATAEGREKSTLDFKEYFKGNFRVMTEEERAATVDRIEKLAMINHGMKTEVATTEAQPGVLFGYAFNISKCQGYLECVKACVQENNQDRESEIQYIRIFEMEQGSMELGTANADFYHEVPAAGHFYLGTQCFQCDKPPCVPVCPVGATWREPDGIVVIDYDWCIGCRYCIAACPYWARRFNWSTPKIPLEEVNRKQHYLGNRPRKKGVVEKCTFCIQRTREGQNPACMDACPTGARIFGNLLDPNSDIRWVLDNKKVFRLKEDLGTEPKFWYFMD